MAIINVSDIVEENGKTIRENNLALSHNIPIGTLVEIDLDEDYGNGAGLKGSARLFVVSHGRDCDGTPLYGLSRYNKTFREFANDLGLFDGYNESQIKLLMGFDFGYGEDSLRVVF